MRYRNEIVFLCLLVFAAKAGAQEFHIKLARTDKQGDTYPISATGSFKTTQVIATAGGEPQKHEQAVDIQLDGDVKVLEVKNNKTTKLQCTVHNCVVNGKRAMDAGTVITAENINSRTVMSIDGKPLEPALFNALDTVLSTEDPADTIGNDEMFGTAGAKKVGDSWPVDSQAVATVISRDSPPVGKDDVKGTVRLVETKEIQHKDALVIEANATATIPPGQFPNGPAFDKAVINIQYACVIPAGPEGKSYSESMSMHIVAHINSQSPDTGPVSGDVTVDRSAKISYMK